MTGKSRISNLLVLKKLVLLKSFFTRISQCANQDSGPIGRSVLKWQIIFIEHMRAYRYQGRERNQHSNELECSKNRPCKVYSRVQADLVWRFKLKVSKT